MYEWLTFRRTELCLSYLCFKRMLHKEFFWRFVAQWTNEWAGREKKGVWCRKMNTASWWMPPALTTEQHWSLRKNLLRLLLLCLSHGAYVKCGCALVESCSLSLNGMHPYRSLNWWIWDLEDLSLWSDTNVYPSSEFAFTCLPEMKCLFVLPFLSAVVDILWHFYDSRKHEGYASDMNDNSKH